MFSTIIYKTPSHDFNQPYVNILVKRTVFKKPIEVGRISPATFTQSVDPQLSDSGAAWQVQALPRRKSTLLADSTEV